MTVHQCQIGLGVKAFSKPKPTFFIIKHFCFVFNMKFDKKTLKQTILIIMPLTVAMKKKALKHHRMHWLKQILTNTFKICQ